MGTLTDEKKMEIAKLILTPLVHRFDRIFDFVATQVKNQTAIPLTWFRHIVKTNMDPDESEKIVRRMVLQTITWITIKPATVPRGTHYGNRQSGPESNFQRGVHDHIMLPLLKNEMDVEDTISIFEIMLLIATGIIKVND